MRALRGNTVEEMFNIALWNARELHADACPAREASRAVPNTAAAIGFPLSFQYAIFDPQAADGLSHTGGATAVIN